MSAAADGHGPRDVGRGYSSSPDLSSPPSAHSPTNISPSRTAAQPTHVLPSQDVNQRDGNGNGNGNVGGEKATKGNLAKYPPPGPKKVRKKREPYNKNESKSSTTTATDGREPVPKVRKTRGPYNVSSHSTGGRKKKVVVESNHEPIPPPAPHLPRQTKITDTVRSTLPPHDFGALANSPAHQNGNNEVIAKPNLIPPVPASTPRSSSGQNYDPIRSATIEPRTVSPLLPFNAPVRSSTPPRPPPKYTSASASPSIASLIEPASSNQAYNFPKPPKRNHDMNLPASPTIKKARLSPPPPSVYEVPKTIATNPYGANVPPFNDRATAPVDIDIDHARPAYAGPTSMVKISNSTSTGASSAAHSPKPPRPKEPPIALPSGNGLLSSAMFGGGYDGTGPEKVAPTVILHVSLDGGDNKYVNFARMAEERYGFNALHPRLAAQRERLARVAAAGAAIENAHKVARNSGSGVSGDEMSVDLSENDLGGEDSNMEMGGTSLHDIEMGGLGRSGGEGSEATLVKKVPKKRLMKEDYYDKDDPFVDDTELAWEEQAAASKDGFFVYSGPLVPEGEKAVVERYVGPPPFYPRTLT